MSAPKEFLWIAFNFRFKKKETKNSKIEKKIVSQRLFVISVFFLPCRKRSNISRKKRILYFEIQRKKFRIKMSRRFEIMVSPKNPEGKGASFLLTTIFRYDIMFP